MSTRDSESGNNQQSATFQERLDALVGKPIRGDSVSHAPDPVNQPMIRHWAAAFEDHNAAYVDAEFAARSRFGGIVAPPLMLQTWTMATPMITGIRERGGSPVPSEGESALGLFDDAGFTATLASNSEFEIDRYLRLDDVISATTVVESISTEKQTRVGRGHFLTWLTTYVDQNGETVGTQRFRILKFMPGTAA